MPIKSVTSRDNPSYREVFALAEDRQARREAGRTILDGEHLLADALRVGVIPRQLAFSEDALNGLAWAEHWPEVPAMRLPDNLFKRLSPVATPSGVLAVIDIPKPAVEMARQDFVVMLEGIQEPGNLGALLRTAAAAGADAAYLSKGCAEAWSPKALRGGQGGHFQLDILEGVDLENAIRRFEGPVYAAVLGADRVLYDLPLTGRSAFIFGNEGAGLSASLSELAQPFTIPMPGSVESLNVAAAAAVCMFERTRQCLLKE